MKNVLLAWLGLSSIAVPAALAHPGPRVWIGNTGGQLTTFSSDNDLAPSTYAPSRIFVGGIDEDTLTPSGLLDELIPGAGVFSTEFPGFQVRTSGGNITSGSLFDFNIAGPLRYFDQTDQTFVTTQQAFGTPGPAPQMGVSVGNNLRITGPSAVTGFTLLNYNSGDAHGHLSFTLYGNGTGPTDGPLGVYAIPLQLTGAGLTDSKTFYILFGRGVDVTQQAFQDAIAIAPSLLSVRSPLALKWSGTANSSAWNTSTSSNWTDGMMASQTFLAGDSVSFDDAAGIGGSAVVLSGSLSPASVTVSNSSAVPYSFTTTTGGLIAGAASLTKTGSGLLIIDTANSYTGETSITGGTLLATKTAALPGYNTAGKVTIASGATLAIRAGGVGGWADADLAILQTNASFAAGSLLGIDVPSGNSFTCLTDITGAKGLVKSGQGTLTLANSKTFTGGIAVTGGVLDAATGTISSSVGAATVTGNASQLIAKTINPSSLTIGAGAKLKLTAVDTASDRLGRSSVGTLTNSGLLDLGQTGMKIATATEAVIRAQILAGRAGGTWAGTSGITSANAALNPNTRAVGYLVSGGQITVAQTILGDASLDGTVDITDLGVLAQNYGLPGKNWQTGDFNYDGTVDIADLGILAQNYSQVLSDMPDVVQNGSAQFQRDFASVYASTSVPEPISTGLIGLTTMGLFVRSRRRTRLVVSVARAGQSSFVLNDRVH